MSSLHEQLHVMVLAYGALLSTSIYQSKKYYHVSSGLATGVLPKQDRF